MCPIFKVKSKWRIPFPINKQLLRSFRWGRIHNNSIIFFVMYYNVTIRSTITSDVLVTCIRLNLFEKQEYRSKFTTNFRLIFTNYFYLPILISAKTERHVLVFTYFPDQLYLNPIALHFPIHLQLPADQLTTIVHLPTSFRIRSGTTRLYRF